MAVRKTQTRLVHISLKKLLEGFKVKTPIAWGKARDEHWAQLDIVYRKLKNCNSLTEVLDLLQNTIYSEAVNVFGHSIHLKEIWLDKAGLNCPPAHQTKRLVNSSKKLCFST